MTPALFPEIAQSTFQPLLGRLTQAAPIEKMSVDEMRGLLMASEVGAAALDKIWEMLQNMLHNGIESRRLRSIIGDLAPALGTVLWVHAQLRNLVENGTLSSDEKRTSVRGLDEFQRRVTAMRKELSSLQELANKPPPQVDLAAIIAADASHDRSKSQKVEDIIARLRAGEDA